MSTTESDSRTTEPPTPPEGAYTGSWSDWITGAPAPVRGGARYDEEYHRAGDYDGPGEYDEYGDFDEYDDLDDADEYQARHRAVSGPWAAEAAARAAAEQRSPRATDDNPPPKRPQRARTYGSPRAQSAYDVLRARASFDPASQSRPDDRLGIPPGYPTERRPLKRATKPSSARERVGLSLSLSGRQQWTVPLLGLLAVLAVTGAIAVQIAKVTDDGAPAKPHVATPQAAAPVTSGTPAAPTASAFAQPAAGAAETAGPANLCPNEAKGGNVRGNGPGSTKSGPDVILALQNRYYVDRSGKAVREMFAPDAAAPTVEQIQAGIDSIPAGTTYCVQIMPGPFDGQHVMVVSENHPDATKRTWSPQLVITTKVGDATLISAIVPMNEDTPK